MKRRVLFLLGMLACLGLKAAFAHSELVFVPNKGQWKERFDFKASGEGVSLFFTSGKATIVMTPPVGHPQPARPAAGTPKGFAFEIAFTEALAGIEPSSQKPIGHAVNYIGATGSYSTSPALSFKYPKCLPGSASLVWRGDEGRATFDIEVPAGADVSRLGFEVRGTELALNAKGEARLQSPYGLVLITAPKAFQVSGSKTWPVQCRFHRKEKGKIGFRVGRGYDPSLPLTIDPTLVFSTYSGSRADNWGNTATYGPGGTMFSGGIAFDRGFPATLGALDTGYHGSVDIGILKYSADGKKLLWATYLGGTKTETPHSLIATPEGQLYVLGSTSSDDFPTRAGSFDRTFNGGPSADPMGYGPTYWYPSGADFVISCLDTDGARLVASTFLGGTGNDGILPLPDGANLTRNYGDQFKGEIVLDAQGRVCIAGTTFSNDFPVRNGLNRTYQGNGDAVVARLSADLSTLVSASYYGGAGREAAYGLALDSLGNTYITGGTQSGGLAGAAGPAYGGGTDGFLLALSPNWQMVQRARYLGTSAYDQSFLVQTDREGNVYATGQTSGNWPITTGAYNNPRGGQFLVSFTPGLVQSRFTTRFGGTSGAPDLVLTAFLVDDCGKIYVSGWGGRTNQELPEYIGGSTLGLPITANAHQRTTDGSDFYLMVLERNATALQYGTFMGGTSQVGEHVDGGTSRFDKKGVVYQAVCGCGGSSFPTTPDVWSPQNQSGNCNNAGFKFDFSLLKARFTTDTLAGCTPFMVRVHNRSEFAQTFRWTFGTDTSTRRDSVFTYTFHQPGSFSVTLRAINPDVCQVIDSSALTVTAYAAEALPDTVIRFCRPDDTLQLNNRILPGYRYKWQNIEDSLLAQPRVAPTEASTYTCQITSPQGCTAIRTVTVPDHRHTAELILSIALPNACVPYPMQPSLRGLGINDSIRWDYGDGFTFVGAQAPRHIYTRPGLYTMRVTGYADTLCDRIVSDSALLSVGHVEALPDTAYRYCAAADSLILQNAVLPGYTYQWMPAAGLSSDTAAQPVFRPGSGPVDYSVTITSALGCEATRHVQVADGRLSVNFQTLFGPNLCLGSERPSLSVVNDRQAWEQIRWTVNGIPHRDSTNTTGDPWEHFLGGLRMDTAGRYTFRIEVASLQTCLPMVADSLTIGVGRTGIPGDTALILCPEDEYVLQAPMQGAMAVVRWLPADSVSVSFSSRFIVPETITAALIDTFGCSMERYYRLDRQRLSSQAEVTPVYNPCNDSFTINFSASPIPPAEGAGWAWQDQILGRNSTVVMPGRNLNDTAFLHVSLRGCGERVPFLVQAQGSPINVDAAFTTQILYSGCGQYPTIRLQYDSVAAPCPSCRYRWVLPDQSQSIDGGVDYAALGRSNSVSLTVSSGPCTLTATKTIEVGRLEIPNIVTPNGDGRNDHFRLPEDGQKIGFDIYNRYGKRVHSGSGATWPKADTPAGTYFYRVGSLLMQRECTGWVEVVR